ncbi:MAG: hypothetical protein K0R51_3269 [Cytophagaceae bacterium]|jgi:hypothetical protein|nr:hypothetical protein [Cytophagaceae bacterium]
MKKIYTYSMSMKRTVLLMTLLAIVLFAGCKRNDDEVNSSFIEEKLSGGYEQEWVVPFYLSATGCNAGNLPPHLTLNADHEFDYSGDCIHSGSWNAEYSTNRSGQFLILNLTYFNGLDYQTDTIHLKYSAEYDIFYNVDPNDQSLVPFEKVVFAP